MKMPRFSISGLMALVALVALEFWICQTLMNPRTHTDMCDLVVFGMLPMANVLLLGLLPFRSRIGRALERPRLIGFEVFGLVALLLFSAACLVAEQAIHEGVGDVLQLLPLHLGVPIFLALAVLLMLLPQLALAALGAWLNNRYKIRVKIAEEPHTIPKPEPTSSEAGAVDSPMRVGSPEVG